MAARAFDVVLYGATGFTGRLCAAYMAAHAPAGVRWAVAGRSAEKLARVVAEVTGGNAAAAARVGVLTADATSPASLRAMTAQARVVLSTVGPFILYGEPLVAACVDTGTDYVDSTGETDWVYAMTGKYGAAAKERKVALVSMCGFDSIPADVGTLMVTTAAAARGVRVNDVTAYVQVKAGTSGGTVASALAKFDNPVRGADLFNPTLLVPRGADLPAPATLVEPTPPSFIPFWVPSLRKYAHFFFMSPVNVNVVRKSAALAALAARAAVPGAAPYSESPFRYTEFQVTSSLLQAVVMTLGIALFAFLARFAAFRNFARRFLPAPGEGPSDTARAASFFRYTVVGRTEEAVPRTITAVVAGGDPGYTETSKMLCESAMCLATQRDTLPLARHGFGFLSPAAALGPAIVDRLRAAGMTMTVDDSALGGTAPAAVPAPRL